MFKLVADSSCGIRALPGVDFVSVPLTISAEGEDFVDDETLDVSRMLTVLESCKGRTYTACPPVNAWLESFRGADTVYVVTMTSALSGTYNSAMAAREAYLQENPQAKVEVFDTLTTGAELGLFVEELARLAQSGLSFEEVCAQARAYLKRTRLFFVLRSLRNLAQNGRVSKAVAAAVGVLNLRIIATGSPEGTIAPITKCRGDKKIIPLLLEQLERAGVRGGRFRVGHTENPELARELKETLERTYPGAQVTLFPAGGLCGYYGERGALFLGAET